MDRAGGPWPRPPSIPPRRARGRGRRAAFDAIQAGSLLEIEPPDHTRVKQMVHAVFTPRHVRALQRRIGALVERLTESEVVANAVLFLNAGHEAVVNVTGNGMLALLRHPDQLRAVRDDPALLRRAIEEMMRYDTPLQFFERFVLEDMTYAGQAWPAGTKLCLTFAAANRDPEVFVDPERFDVRRDPNPHLAFGLGLHYCIGAPLARLELGVSLGAMPPRSVGAGARGDPVTPRGTLDPMTDPDQAFYRAWAALLGEMRAYADGRGDVIFQKEADFPDYIYRMERPYDLPTIVMSASLSRPDGHPVLLLNASPRHAVFKEVVLHSFESHVYRKLTLADDGVGLAEGARRFDGARLRALADRLLGPAGNADAAAPPDAAAPADAAAPENAAADAAAPGARG